MKKILYIILLVLGIFCFSVYSFAYGKEKAGAETFNKTELVRLKNLFAIDKEYKDFNISENQIFTENAPKFLKDRIKGKVYYYYSWEDENLGSINIETTSEGDILSYSNYNYKENDNNSKSYTIDKKEALKASDELLTKIYKNFKDSYKFTDYHIQGNSGEVSLTYEKYINNTPFPEGTIYVTYSFRDKKITSIVKNFSNPYALAYLKDEDFKVSKDIGLDAAKEASKKLQPFEESYLINNSKTDNLYTIFNFKAIDGETGKLTETNDEYDSLYAKDEAAKSYDGSISLTSVEEKTLDNIKNLKTKADAEKIAKEIFPKGTKISSAKLKSSDNSYYYSIRVDDKNKNGELVLDAKNLNLQSYNFFSEESENIDGTKLKDNEVLKIAKDFTKKYLKDEEIKFEKASVSNWSVYIPRYVNNRLVINNGVRVDVNPKTKSVENFQFSKSNIEFPKDKMAISKERAEEIYYNSGEFSKIYTLTSKGIKLIYTSLNTDTPSVNEKGLIVDANGRIVDFKNQISYPDLDKAKNKEIIENLKYMGYGFVNRNLKDKAKVIDLLSLNYSANDIGEVDDYILKDSAFKKEDLNKDLKEKDLVEFLIKNNINSQVLKLNGIFKDNIFENQKSLGNYEKYYILAKGFNIIDTKANPEENVTIEDLLYTFYNTEKVSR
ncbi:YcdB/YcdC domain-containing protein [Peptoniphilus raoultii]|uniref:YcdB/YcdC domain-containing protein n=1 Tax=Peptoniphilus raoultii TaxID=1776387 RepID=UPI0008DAE4A7|nr:YcdB/YcdC domain-containing protein [Peptoniphilus raoultii]